MEIKKLSVEHSLCVHRILCDAFNNPWSVNTVETLLKSDNCLCLGAFDSAELVGYVALEWVLDEGSLTDIAVLKTHRGQGISKLLMDELIKEANNVNLQFVTLEVRESNIPAISLYKKYGFELVGKRPRYYSDPSEDGLLMTKYLNK